MGLGMKLKLLLIMVFLIFSISYSQDFKYDKYDHFHKTEEVKVLDYEEYFWWDKNKEEYENRGILKYEYDEIGNILRKTFELDGNVKWIDTYKYDEENKLIEYFDADHNLKTVYKYDEYGYLITELIKTNYASDYWFNRDSIVYTNDSRGNCIKELFFNRKYYYQHINLTNKRYTEYDVYNNIILYIDSSGRGGDSFSLSSMYKKNYAYSNSKPVAIYLSQWLENEWHFVFKELFNYNEDRVTNYKKYNYINKEYILYIDDNYLYENDYLIEKISRELDVLNNDGTFNQKKTVYHYKSILNVKENYSQNSIIVYPNPATHYLKIILDNNKNIENNKIEIYSINGNLLKIYQIDEFINRNNDLLKIHLDLAPGAYIIKYIFDNSYVQQKFMVVQ